MKPPWVWDGCWIANTLAVEGFWKPCSVDRDGNYTLSLTRAETEDAGWGDWLPFIPFVQLREWEDDKAVGPGEPLFVASAPQLPSLYPT